MSTAKKRGLGRGLDALLGPKGATAIANPVETTTAQPGDTLRTLDIDLLQPGKYQPRQEMDPAKLAELADSIKAQGVIQPIVARELAPGKFEARLLAQTWSFKPNEIKVKAGSKVTFYVTSKDVMHGFHIDETNVNFMIIPGQVSKLSHTFDKPGTYKIICHEYCGIGHQTMFAQIIVEP
jgi:heme/copper-type cytochrome/quinol oxidase subunit 2